MCVAFPFEVRLIVFSMILPQMIAKDNPRAVKLTGPKMDAANKSRHDGNPGDSV
jgi:hypothetical protein